jgi:uncharacterized protein (TIGR00730 family)
VFCGSSDGNDPVYGEAAAALGQLLAERGLRLVYGGSAVGLMSTVADAALAAGGEVVGVIPRGLFRREIAHRGLTELLEVGSMHERKEAMFERSDAFVALPGGLGTLEELAEVATWVQLGIHNRPVVTLDVAGFWQPLHAFLRHAVEAGFLKADNLDLIANVDHLDRLLPVLETHRVGRLDPSIGLAET